MSEQPKHIKLHFVSIELYQDYAISVIEAGVFFDFKHLEEISAIFTSHYGSRSFVSIANRKNDYTINPTCLLHSDYIPNLLGIAVVSHTPSAYTTAKFEEQFYKNPFKVFHNLENAIDWAKLLIKDSDTSRI